MLFIFHKYYKFLKKRHTDFNLISYKTSFFYSYIFFKQSKLNYRKYYFNTFFMGQILKVQCVGHKITVEQIDYSFRIKNLYLSG